MEKYKLTTYKPGKFCPTCPGNREQCYHWCNTCGAKFSEGWKNNDGRQVTKNGKLVPHDEYGIVHKCMSPGSMHGKWINQGVVTYVNEKNHDLHEYMRNHLKLGNDGWWHLFRDDKYSGRYEKAGLADYKSWSP